MIKKILAAAALTAVAFGAQATLTGGVAANQSPSSFIVLSAADVSGGALYTGPSVAGAAVPNNISPSKVTVGEWLAAGPTNLNNGGGDATVSFAAPTAFASFLWGSPDKYNTLVVTTDVMSYTFTSIDFPVIVANGNQDFASYLGFNAADGEMILSITFESPVTNAFEASNFSVTTPIPEPETYALMLAGLGAMGFVARRRKSV